MCIRKIVLYIVFGFYSPFCVPAKVIKLVRLTRTPFLSPTNLISFAGTQNGKLILDKVHDESFD